MLFSLVKQLEKFICIKSASAHCDIPCKIYDPINAQIATLSVIRFLDFIDELKSKEQFTLAEHAQLSRLIQEKEVHAKKVKEEITVIWGDYFKQPQFVQFPNIHTLVHNIMLTASACKQSTSKENGEKLLELVNEFSAAFWSTKNISTFSATCPYPPSKTLTYPKLS